MDRTRDLNIIYGYGSFANKPNNSIIQEQRIIEENIKNKILKLEKNAEKAGLTLPIDGLTKAFLTKREDSIDWNKLFSGDSTLSDVINTDIENTKTILKKGSDQLKKSVYDMEEYLGDNNYPKVFSALLLRDYTNSFIKQTAGFPSFDSAVVAEVFGHVKGNENFGNLGKVYKTKLKEMVQSEGGKHSGRNKWVFINGAERGSEDFIEKSRIQMGLSSNKTKWCLRGQAGCNEYDEDDFYFYLDGDGDAIISIRIRDGVVTEVSGTKSNQDLTDEEKEIASEFIFIEKKFKNLNKDSVKRRLKGFIKIKKPNGWEKEITKWARELYKNRDEVVIDFSGDSGDFNYTSGDVDELFNYISMTHEGVTYKDGNVIRIKF